MSENPTQYSGEFALTKNGSPDFGEINVEIAGLIVLKNGNRFNTAYVQLAPSSDGDFHDVKTVVSSNRNVVKNKTPLWKKLNSGI